VADVVGYFMPPTLPTAGRAFAAVQRTPSVAFDALKTKGFSAVTRPSTGIYCLTPSVDVSNPTIMVSVEWGNSLGNDLVAVSVQTPLPFTPCTGSDIQIRTYDFGADVANPVLTLSDQVAFNVFIP
jgi:hypothetical protein